MPVICYYQSGSCHCKITSVSNDILLVVVKSWSLSSKGEEWRFLLFDAEDLLVLLILLFCFAIYLFCCWSLAKVWLPSDSTARKLIFMPSRVYAKNRAEISYPRLHLNHKEAKKTFLTSRLTSCKSKTITQTFRFASPSGQFSRKPQAGVQRSGWGSIKL